MEEITAKELAAQLEGINYRSRLNKNLLEQAKASGLVIVYGMSDDLMEFDGAIREELDAYGGTTAYISPEGLLQNDCAEHDCPYFKKIMKRAATIDALWAQELEYSWTFRTEIPHEKFEIIDDGEPYCRGIVFRLADVPELPK